MPEEVPSDTVHGQSESRKKEKTIILNADVVPSNHYNHSDPVLTY